MAVLDYIHRNPVHHGFVQHSADWPWSSRSAQSDQGLVTKQLDQNTLLEAIAVDNFAYQLPETLEFPYLSGDQRQPRARE